MRPTLLGLTLSACAAPSQDAAAQAAPAEVSATETASATTTTASTTPAADVTEPVTTPATGTTVPVAPATPVSPAPVAPAPQVVVPALKTFTFPDGHISFAYPSSWTVKTKQGPYLDYVNNTDKAKSVEAHIYDETGNELAQVASGGYGGGAAGPEFLTVIDSQPLPALPDLLKGGNATFVFIEYDNAHSTDMRYYMGLMDDRFVANGEGTSGSPYLLLPNGAALAMVKFNNPAFTSLANAKAWMGSQQYSQLKNMLTSLRYV
jgi:hypothetical protein